MTANQFTPPRCINEQCPDRPMLWKDTTRTRPGAERNWRWYCTSCGRCYAPSGTHLDMFTWPATR